MNQLKKYITSLLLIQKRFTKYYLQNLLKNAKTNEIEQKYNDFINKKRINQNKIIFIRKLIYYTMSKDQQQQFIEYCKDNRSSHNRSVDNYEYKKLLKVCKFINEQIQKNIIEKW